MFQVKLFGYFRMEKEGKLINEASMRSPQLLKLLVYLILYRSRAVTSGELERYLWDESQINSQKDALKNLICRLRRELEENFGKATYISTGRGSYQWNTELKMDIDVENFENFYNLFLTQLSENPKEAIINREKAIELYQGTFLKNYEAEYWGNLGLKYQNMYLKLVENKLGELQEKEDYPEIEKLCTKVLNTDPYDEGWNITLVRTLMEQKKITHAEKYYRGLEKSMQNKNGVQKNSLLRIIKKELKSTGLNKKVIKTEEFFEEIESQNKQKSAFKCDYREFKALCQLQKRKCERHNDNTYIILVTTYVDNQTLGAAIEVQDYLINMAMEELEEQLIRNLRDCDVLCKCSDSQYITLLDSCSYENALGVARRVTDLFLKGKSSKIMKININITKIRQ